MADENSGGASTDASNERRKVVLSNIRELALIDGGAGMSIGIVAVAGKMFQSIGNASIATGFDDGASVLRGELRILTETAAKHIVGRVGRDVDDGSKIEVYTETTKELTFRDSIGANGIKTAFLVERLRRLEGVLGELRVTTDTDDGAAFLVDGGDEWDFSDRLETRHESLDFGGRAVAKILSKEDVAAELILF